MTEPRVSTAPGDTQPAYSEAVDELLRTLDARPALTSGAVVGQLLKSNPTYVDPAVARDKFDEFGEERNISGHVDAAKAVWDPELVPVLSGRHMVLALALDPGLGTVLVESGAIASLLRSWQPGLGTDQEPYSLVWDVLTDEGRLRFDEQPLLAGAIGAPGEWTAELPDDVTELAWSPSGERLAALAGNVVFELAAGRPPHRLGEVASGVTSLGWDEDGVVALRIEVGDAELVRVPTGTVVGTRPSVTGGRVSGDGTRTWLKTSDGVINWSPAEPDTTVIGPASEVLAVAPAGRLGLVRYGNDELAVSDQPSTLPASRSRVEGEPDWPGAASQLAGWTAAGPVGPRALIAYGPLLAEVATAGSGGGGVEISSAPWPVKARLATGAGQVTALAANRNATQLAVAVGRRVSVWTISAVRPTSRNVPGYDSDRASGPDLLGADRDAQALAALIASRDLRPPLTIGLFGAWGSGKSFLLNRIEALIGDYTSSGAPDGYIGQVSMIRFNAWQYAEANLWASLVDHVLQGIGPAQEVELPKEVEDAVASVVAETTRGEKKANEVKEADKDLQAAKDALVKRRTSGWRLVAGLLALAAIGVVAAVLGGPGRMVAAGSLALALVGSASAAYGQAKLAAEHAGNLIEAGKAGVGTFGRLTGRPEELAVRAAATKFQEVTNELDLIKAKKGRLQTEADELRELAKNEPLGALLHNLATVTEYRDQLSLIARTRQRFGQIDTAVRTTRQLGRRATSSSRLERVVIVIDDLDRCPPEKVVRVLEAVHLLFDFEMFVVVLAVDTRWLDQSLRIRYRQLLGEANTAAPVDYLEKIIQIPIQLPPLDEELVRKLISGLTRQAPADPADAQPEPAPEEAPDQPETPVAVQPSGVIEAVHQRPVRSLPAKVLQISPVEAMALAEVGSLVGTTPRTVKRFVNTYQLIKARADDPAAFAAKEGLVDPAGIVAFLLAVLTGRSAVAHRLFRAIVDAAAGSNLQAVVKALQPPPTTPATRAADPIDPVAPAAGLGRSAAPVADSAEREALQGIQDWLTRHPAHANILAETASAWVQEVARFSFTSATPKADSDRST